MEFESRGSYLLCVDFSKIHTCKIRSRFLFYNILSQRIFTWIAWTFSRFKILGQRILVLGFLVWSLAVSLSLYMYVCIYACMYVSIYIYIYIYIILWTCSCVNYTLHITSCTRWYAIKMFYELDPIYIYIYIHICTYIYTYVYILWYKRSYFLESPSK